MVLSVLIPRFELLAACSADWRALRTPAALAPVPGGPGRVGQVSSAAESYGVKTGMRLGEALSRCPDLNLIPPDPALAARLGEEILLRLEQIGAAVEPGRPGEAFLETEGLHGLYGGRDGTVARVRGALASQRAIAAALRLAVAPGRFTARLAAALERPVVTAAEAADFLAPLPVTNLDLDPGLDYELIRNFERLGFTTLGELAALPTEAVADRFGSQGLRAHFLAQGGHERLQPRGPVELLEESLELPDALDGSQLGHALELLIDRFLALPELRGRAMRSLVLSAGLAGGGSWRRAVALNQASGSAQILRLALLPKLDQLPGPVDSLSLQAGELSRGGAVEQTSLISQPGERRRGRISEAVRQTRATAGSDALLRILNLDPEARRPEHRLKLSPFEVRRK